MRLDPLGIAVYASHEGTLRHIRADGRTVLIAAP